MRTLLTQLYLLVEYKVFFLFLNKLHLHVSALDNGNIQVVDEILTLYSTNKYNCVGRVHTLYISYV